ncbi:serine protease P40 [Tribolium castaneum]|uniref:Serine protease P40 n=1 Tax=Tribolium castaneum TaxID=7070 RepID=D6WIP3_TRICA|nr:serine protease P40 [Tribolium castaneum]
MISKIIVTLFLALFGVVQGTPINVRIVNGTDAKEGEFPYIVSLRLFGNHNCAGSILNARTVLTAAHCVVSYDVSLLSVQYGIVEISSGDSAPNVVQVSKVTFHENYTAGNGYINDIAVVEVTKPIVFGAYVQPTNLPIAFNATPENSPALLAGWGLPYSGGTVMKHLQKVNIFVYSDDDCERIHKETGPTNRKYHVCAGVPEGGKGQCNGDSGGPLTVNGVQVGIVSWSVKPCAIKGYPGVFTKVSSHVSWIRKHIANT